MIRKAILLCIISLIPLVKGWAGSDELTISGYHTMYFNAYSISGDESLYKYDNYGSESKFQDYTNLYVRGRLFGNAFIDAQLSRDRFSPESNKLTLEYKGEGFNLKAGAILASLMGNEFASLNKSLNGLLLTTTLGKDIGLSLVASRSRGSTKIESFRGNNSAGPYYLRFSPIVEGSEVVKVDDVMMRRGIDYQLDYYTGELNFLGANIITPASLITVSYEYLYEKGGSSILGFRVGRKDNWGITFLSRPGFKYTPPTEASREEYYIGSGTPGPFYLFYRPVVEGSEEVVIDGVLQGKESYQINYLTGAITFNKPVHIGASVVIRYRYKLEAGSLGSKRVVGLDGVLRVKGLPLLLQVAQSTDGFHSGSAFGLRLQKNLSGKTGNWSVSYNLRSIGKDFAPLESVGFFRQERGHLFNLRWTSPDQFVTADLNFSSGKRPFGYFFSSTNALAPYKNLSLNINISTPSLPNITFSHLVDSAGGTYNYFNQRDELRISSSKLFKKEEEAPSAPFEEQGLTSEMGTPRYELPTSYPSMGYYGWGLGGYYPSTSSSYYYGGYYGYEGGYRGYGTPRRMGQIGFFTPGISWNFSLSRIEGRGGYEGSFSNRSLLGRFNLIYVPNEKMKFSADLARNKSSTTSSVDSFQVAYNPSEKLSFSFSLDNSNSGLLASSFDYSQPIAPGYYYGGLAPGMKQKRRTLDVQFLPTSRVTLGLSLNHQYSEGGYSTNTSSDGVNLFLTYLLSSHLSLTSNFLLQNMDFIGFIGAAGGMKSKVGFLTLTYQPFSSLPYFNIILDYQLMNTTSRYGDTSTSALAHALRVFSLRVQNPLRTGKTLFAQLQKSKSSGTAPYSRFEISTGIDFQLQKHLTFTLDLRRINYTGGTRSSGSSLAGYKAFTLNGALSLRF